MLVSLFSSIYLSVIAVGLTPLAVSSLGARQLAVLNRALGRRWLGEEIAPPRPFQPGPGIVG